LYNWLLARQSPESRLVLRLEDTDRERSTDEAVAQILEALAWLELDWDEGPHRQTDRSDRYAERLEELLASGTAYWDVATGEDVLSNTPRQLLVLGAIGADAPLYAHLPLLHGTDGKPLSKRHGAASVQELRDAGYLREAVRNYLALLGWGYDETTTFFSSEE